MVEIDTSSLWQPKLIANSAKWDTSEEFLAFRGVETVISIFAIVYLIGTLFTAFMDYYNRRYWSVWSL